MLDRYGDYLIVMGMAYAWHSATGHPAALLVGAAALAGMPLSMLFKEKFRNAFGRPFIPEDYDGWLRYAPVNRDGRLFVVMLGGHVKPAAGRPGSAGCYHPPAGPCPPLAMFEKQLNPA